VNAGVDTGSPFGGDAWVTLAGVGQDDFEADVIEPALVDGAVVFDPVTGRFAAGTYFLCTVPIGAALSPDSSNTVSADAHTVYGTTLPPWVNQYINSMSAVAIWLEGIRRIGGVVAARPGRCGGGRGLRAGSSDCRMRP
jgi:hypothetical protein